MEPFAAIFIAHRTHVFGRGTPEAQRAKIQGQRPRAGSSDGQNVGRSLFFYFLLSTSSPAEPLDIIGRILRLRRTPVEKHCCDVM